MPKSVTVEIAERTYTITQLPMEQNAAWRKRVQESQLLGILGNLDGVVKDVIHFFDAREEGRLNELNLNEFIGTFMAIPAIAMRLAHGMDDVIELVFAYSHELRKDRPHILKNAYDDDIMEVFVRILPLAFPYTGLISAVARGVSPSTTSTNSPSVNGTSGRHAERANQRKALTS